MTTIEGSGSNVPKGRKHPARFLNGVLESVLTWPDVLRCLQTDAARSYVLDRFRGSGFSAESWKQRAARVKIADLLTALEDRLEKARARAVVADRAASRAFRRRLESELWP
jgi:hypothetical protein